jgi:hypothetical protein
LAGDHWDENREMRTPHFLAYFERYVRFCIALFFLLGFLAANLFSSEASFSSTSTVQRIDELVYERLKLQNIPFSPQCSDAVFVRRLFLDVLGTLPTRAEVRAFLAEKRSDKRSLLIESVLARPEYADYWGMKWGDLLRIKAEFPSNLWPQAAALYDRWVRDALRANQPYDRFVTDLLTTSGSNFRDPPANFYRAFQERSPAQIAQTVAILFLGTRMEKAGWTNEQIQGFSAFFAKIAYKSTDEWKEEIVYFNPSGVLVDPQSKETIAPAFPDGIPVVLRPEQDPRRRFAGWLTTPENPWFAKAMANRVWYWLMGRGIVHEPDDFRPNNPAWSQALLDYLGAEFAGKAFDVKHLFRLILNSQTYQRDWSTNDFNVNDEAGFSHYRLRRLDAEVLIDAISQITGSWDNYSSDIPEPFTYMNGFRAIRLPDASISSAFLETFGRSARNTCYESERSTTPSVFQVQYLLNSSHIQKKLMNSWVLKQIVTNTGPKGGPAKIVEELYLHILSRFPTEAETAVALTYAKEPSRSATDAVCDLAWALINTKEFQLKH